MSPSTEKPRARCVPLGARMRRRLLAMLVEKAERGDVAAAESLVRLSLAAAAASKAPRRRARTGVS